MILVQVEFVSIIPEKSSKLELRSTLKDLIELSNSFDKLPNDLFFIENNTKVWWASIADLIKIMNLNFFSLKSNIIEIFRFLIFFINLFHILSFARFYYINIFLNQLPKSNLFQNTIWIIWAVENKFDHKFEKIQKHKNLDSNFQLGTLSIEPKNRIYVKRIFTEIE